MHPHIDSRLKQNSDSSKLMSFQTTPLRKKQNLHSGSFYKHRYWGCHAAIFLRTRMKENQNEQVKIWMFTFVLQCGEAVGTSEVENAVVSLRGKLADGPCSARPWVSWHSQASTTTFWGRGFQGWNRNRTVVMAFKKQNAHIYFHDMAWLAITWFVSDICFFSFALEEWG